MVMDPARVLANRYRLQDTIGRGGMGIVHRAIDQELERAVAVKVLGEGHDDSAFDRFITEAKRTAAVRHPSIVEVFDVGKDGDEAFLVMELLEGQTLADRLREGASLPAAEAIAIAEQICEALAAAHDAGLVHRDLKPANVFLVRTADGAPRVKLLDFGIAKRIDGNTARTDPSVIVGTLEYLSPEQIRGGDLDGRADLYSLGTTLYRMLTGELPFKGDNVAAFIHQHLSVAPASLRQRPALCDLPPALDAAVLKLLEKDPRARPASARDAKRELSLALAGKSPVTRREVVKIVDSAARGTERVLDLEDEAAGSAEVLELDLKGSAPRVPADAPRGPAIVPVTVPPPPAPMAPIVEAPRSEPLASWLEPLARVPETASKRVAGYATFALFVYLVFFSGALLPSLGLALIAVLGGVSFWARRRSSPRD